MKSCSTPLPRLMLLVQTFKFYRMTFTFHSTSRSTISYYSCLPSKFAKITIWSSACFAGERSNLPWQNTRDRASRKKKAWKPTDTLDMHAVKHWNASYKAQEKARRALTYNGSRVGRQKKKRLRVCKSGLKNVNKQEWKHFFSLITGTLQPTKHNPIRTLKKAPTSPWN